MDATKEAPKGLVLTLLKKQDANFRDAVKIAEQNGGRLIRTDDFAVLSKTALNELVTTVKKGDWFWLGDEKDLNLQNVDKLKDYLARILGEQVNTYRGRAPFAFYFQSMFGIGPTLGWFGVLTGQSIKEHATTVAYVTEERAAPLKKMARKDADSEKERLMKFFFS